MSRSSLNPSTSTDINDNVAPRTITPPPPPVKKQQQQVIAEEVPVKVDMQAQYETEIVKKRHNCTDIICLILFAAFCLTQLCLSILIYIQPGDPRNLLYPHDSNGKLCSGDTKNLFYFNIIECISASSLITGCTSATRCVSSCPTSIKYYTIQSDRNFMLANLCNQESLNSYYNNIVPSTISLGDYSTLMSRRICPAYSVPSEPTYYRCIPSITSTGNVIASDASTVTDKDGSTISYAQLQKGIDYISQLLNIKGIAQFLFEDFYNSWVLILVLLVIAAIASFLYIIIMRWVLAPLIYLSIIGVIGLLAFGVYYCTTKFIELGAFSNKIAFVSTTTPSDFIKNAYSWFIMDIVCILMLIIILLILLVMIKRLRFAIQIICESSKAVQAVFITLVWPLVPLLLQLIFYAYFFINAVLMASAGEAIFKVANSTTTSVSVGSVCKDTSTTTSTCVFESYGFDGSSQFSSIMAFLSKYQYVPQLFNIFMMFWVQAFIVAFNQMVLAGSFGIWYWSQNKVHMIFLTSMKDTLIYHIGTLAFGSLLIALCKFARFIISQVEKRLKSAIGSKVKLVTCIVTFVSCCCRCCLWCLEKFIRYVNRKAYIMCAIYGSNFCMSALSAFKLLLANPAKTLILDGVSFFLLMLGKLLITAGVSALAFYSFTREFNISNASVALYFQPTLHYYWFPLIVVILGSFYIAKLFLSVFEMAVDTVFLCALKDLDIHDGTAEKPYFMSIKLMEIMSKKNKTKTVKKNKVVPVQNNSAE